MFIVCIMSVMKIINQIPITGYVVKTDNAQTCMRCEDDENNVQWFVSTCDRWLPCHYNLFNELEKAFNE